MVTKEKAGRDRTALSSWGKKKKKHKEMGAKNNIPEVLTNIGKKATH